MINKPSESIDPNASYEEFNSQIMGVSIDENTQDVSLNSRDLSNDSLGLVDASLNSDLGIGNISGGRTEVTTSKEGG